MTSHPSGTLIARNQGQPRFESGTCLMARDVNGFLSHDTVVFLALLTTEGDAGLLAWEINLLCDMLDRNVLTTAELSASLTRLASAGVVSQRGNRFAAVPEVATRLDLTAGRPVSQLLDEVGSLLSTFTPFSIEHEVMLTDTDLRGPRHVERQIVGDAVALGVDRGRRLSAEEFYGDAECRGITWYVNASDVLPNRLWACLRTFTSGMYEVRTPDGQTFGFRDHERAIEFLAMREFVSVSELLASGFDEAREWHPPEVEFQHHDVILIE